MNHCLSEHSKHLNVKWYFFLECVDDGQVKISKCSTDEQQADYLTKRLVSEKFEIIEKVIKARDHNTFHM